MNDAEKIKKLESNLFFMSAAAKTGAKWMKWWLERNECECEGSHSCGFDERYAELRSIERIIDACDSEKGAS